MFVGYLSPLLLSAQEILIFPIFLGGPKENRFQVRASDLKFGNLKLLNSEEALEYVLRHFASLFRGKGEPSFARNLDRVVLDQLAGFVDPSDFSLQVDPVSVRHDLKNGVVDEFFLQFQ